MAMRVHPVRADPELMSIHVALTHLTEYRYDRAVHLSPQLIRLRPAPHCRTTVLSYSQRIAPAAHFLNWQQDPQSNYIARVAFPDPVTEFRVEINLVAELAVYNPFDFFLEPCAERAPFAYDASLVADLQPFLATEPLTPRFKEYLAGVDRTSQRTIDFLVSLNQRLSRDISYIIRLDPGVQAKEETLALGRGSCRDTTWLLVQLLRQMGLAARFVSGYLIQLKPDVKALDGPSGTERDFTDLHAWCEVYLPGAGWIGLDPTSGLLAGEGHIPLACSPEPSSAAPISGNVDECEVEFDHKMSVERIFESPRVTKPYAEAQWASIDRLGAALDADLTSLDVRLTMGGEPTFVSVTDRDAAEWTTDALGPTKRRRATELLDRLRRRFSHGAFIHAGQGKWYPGEQLPRWALGCYWRADGEPVWTDPLLVADEQSPDGSTDEDAELFLRLLARNLKLSDEYVRPAYEDVWYYLWRERQLPANVDPFEARLEDELERDRLRRVFSQGLDQTVGFVMPLALAEDGESTGWRTGPWFLRGERMYLIPGDSPMGFRLPLDSLPWVDGADRPQQYEQDPFAARQPLSAPVARAARTALRQQSASTSADAHAAIDDRVPARLESAPWIVRTAICAEPRNGVLYIFMPPLESVDRYIDLVSAIEATAAELKVRVLMEGYPPPPDPRLTRLVVTPDPGVIEVNVHPASAWRDLVDHTSAIYEEAHQCGLAAEKFMLDGRHTGTGGGNHFVLGGPSAADSPFLRRPDLLRSLVAYWHNHPSLSYLFSGLFLGPTSQAPRVDEARDDSVYELGIAFEQVPPPGGEVPPWLVDRLLRNLLIDATGNTHRAEFCIDKLYSPDTSGGRRGLLELRAFEMPPHPQMSLVQQLLIRGLVAAFWQHPYQTPLTRWGTALHDRFMLPYFVWQDFSDVLEDLRRWGYPFDTAWFAPHFEFRFPVAGALEARAVTLELRQALEPWHVLGEEGTSGGTARYVDSSLERVQVHLTGLTGERFAVLCNGRALPLQPTGTIGEAIAGVRFRAWQPPSCLHPTIPVHAPLTFDVVDTWMNRAVAGCQYHVAHPGGRSYEVFPVNSYEAESRRLSRFSRLAYTPGRLDVAAPVRSREFPFTLDLRTAPTPCPH